MHVTDVLRQVGGVASARQLARATSRRQVLSALAAGDLIRVGRSYALPVVGEGRLAAARLNATMSHRTAALHHGWPIKQPPQRPEVIVPRGRKVPPHRRVGVHVRWRSGPAALVTSPVNTVIDCARDLPFDEALAVADSALRAGDVTQDELVLATQALGSRGRRRAMAVVQAADRRAANPFESVLRAITMQVPGLEVEPQVEITDGMYARCDLVAVLLRLVIEADSFGFHSTRDRLKADCARYNALGVRGWLVLRFSWEQ